MKINKNIFYILILFFVFCLLFFLLKNNIYSFYSDFGREVYIPSAMSKGSVLYKDIFCLYAPLGYLFNSFIVAVFGNSLIVFQLFGFIISFLIIIGLYIIAERFSNKETALFTSLLICVCCVFYPSSSNWITSYSYSLLYALLFIVYSLYFSVKYLDNANNKYLYLAFLLYGASVFSKYEFSLFALILLFILIYKKAPFFVIFKSLFWAIIFPCISLFILFLQKCDISSLFYCFKSSFMLINTESVKYFYSMVGIIPNKYVFFENLKYLYKFNFDTFFVFIGFFNIIFLIVSLIKKSDIRFIILYLSSILISSKCLFSITLNIYGTYFLPLLLVSFVVFIYNLNIKNKKVIISAIILIFISYFYFDIKSSNLTPISTAKGTVNISSAFYSSTKELMNFISLSDSDTFLVIPEGVIVNYLTDKKTDNKLFYLIPPNIDLFGYEYIIDTIKHSNSEYIVISNIMYPWYNCGSFTNSFGNDIIKVIKEKYNLEKVIGDDLIFYVYRIKYKTNGEKINE